MVGKADAKVKPAKKEDEKRPVTPRQLPGRKAKSPTRSVPKSPTRSVPKSPSRTAAKSPTRASAKSPIKVRREKSMSPSRNTKPKSPDRLTLSTQKRGRPKSPARKSPARKSPARRIEPKKSPIRKSPISKSPSRRSPIRKFEADTIKKIYSTQEIVIDSDSDTHSDAASDISKVSSLKLLARLRKTPTKESSVESISNIRRSSRLREHERVVHLKNNYEPVAKLTEFSDEDEVVEEKPKERPSTMRLPKINLSAIFKILFSMLMTLGYFFGMLAVCNENDCSLRVPSLKDFMHIKTYFDLCVFTKYAGYVGVVTLLSVLPFGGRKCTGMPSKSGKLDYVMNGLFSSFVILATAVGMEFNNIHVCSYILDSFYKLAISGFIFALPIAILVFIKSFYVPLSNLNSNVMENSYFHNFLYGCENNPRFGRIDVKLVLFRASFISMLLVATSTMYQSIEFDSQGASNSTNIISTWLPHIQDIKVNWTLFVLYIMMVFYTLDVFIFEHTIVSSAEIQYESFGYMKCLEYCCFISLYALIPKVVMEHNVQLETWKLSIAVVLFITGYIFYRGSNSQKHAFRENPYSPLVAHLESIPTGGKKIICSSYWGIVRHPNYLGDILMNTSFLLFVAWYPPFISILLSVFGLVERAYRDNKRCKHRYGTAWDRYCHRVKYMLIPKVF